MRVPIIERVIGADGWRDASRVLEVVSGVLLAVAALGAHRPPGSAAPPRPIREVISGRRDSWILYVSSLLLSASLFMAFVFMADYIDTSGASGSVAVLLGIIGMASVVGRFALGALAGRLGILRLHQLSSWTRPELRDVDRCRHELCTHEDKRSTSGPSRSSPCGAPATRSSAISARSPSIESPAPPADHTRPSNPGATSCTTTGAKTSPPRWPHGSREVSCPRAGSAIGARRTTATHNAGAATGDRPDTTHSGTRSTAPDRAHEVPSHG